LRFRLRDGAQVPDRSLQAWLSHSWRALEEFPTTIGGRHADPTLERGGTVVRAAAPVPGAPVPLARLGG
jgi:hypothetical protein